MKDLVKIIKIRYIYDYLLEITFDDGCVKQFDFAELFEFKGMETDFTDIGYFAEAKVSHDGRRMEWDNGYDCCADWLRYFAEDMDGEWNGIDETIGLKQRVKIAKQRQFELV